MSKYRYNPEEEEKPVSWWLVLGITAAAALDASPLSGPLPFPGSALFTTGAAILVWKKKLDEYGVAPPTGPTGDMT